MAIAAQLEAKSPHRYEVIVGSTGKLANQIINGAPFDVFMAADRRRPQQLVDRGLALAASEQIYAVGELGLWWPNGPGTPALDALATLEPRSVCVANPAFAPYGEVAWAAADGDVLWFAERAPVDQAMVLLTRAETNVAAQHWIQQMQTPPIRELIQRDGYRLLVKQH